MTKSTIFYSQRYKQIEAAIKELLNSQPDFLSDRTVDSPRATGDAIEGILADKFQAVLGDVCREYSAEFARRAMADLAFKDVENLYYVVDVKTHRREAGFHMPNLTSVERLARFYEDDANYFVVLTVSYTIAGRRVLVEEVHFVPIEFLAWECLTIGALGWGQVQIANAQRITIQERYPRKRWMLERCERLAEFYPREIEKTTGRMEHFRKVKAHWEQKEG